MPRRARYLLPAGLPRRDEILACCLVLAVLAHLLFAQLTLLFALVLAAITRMTGWRPSWLAVPGAAAVAWAAAVGPRAAAAGFAAGPAAVAAYFAASGRRPGHLLHFGGAFTGMGAWLPRQLPLALLAGAAEAAAVGWLTWLRIGGRALPPARPGPLAAARRAAATRAIRVGRIVTRDGGRLGVAAGSGARIALSWSETAGGVGVCGSAAGDVLAAGFQLVHAAVRRRKPVLAVDLTSDPGLPRRLAAVCAAAGAPLQVFGDAVPEEAGPAAGRVAPACYEPFRHGDAARRASLVAAMLSRDGPAGRYLRGCAAYLQDVFELIDAAPGDPGVPVLDEVIHLLNPAAMRARLQQVPAGHPRRAVLAERTRVSVSLAQAEPGATAQLGRELRELRASPLGRWLRPSGRGRAAGIDLGRAVTERGVVLFRLGGRCGGASPVMLARLVCRDLLATAAALRGYGIDGDGIVWLAECRWMPRAALAEMIAAGRDSGLPVLATTTSARAAVELAELGNVLVAYRIGDAAAAREVAAAAGLPAPRPPAPAGGPADPAGTSAAMSDLSALRDGEFLLAVRNPPRLVPRGLLVTARVPRAAGGAGRLAARGAWETA
jgi:hypothetical protein